MSVPSLIILRGYPASGKSTIGSALQEIGAGVFIDHNSILSFIANFTGDDEGVYDEIHNLEKVMTGKILADGKNVIVARGFSTKKQVASYLDVAAKANARPCVITLDAERKLLEKRVVSPERKLGFNPSVSVDALNKWIDENPRQPIDGECVVDVNKSVNEVTSEILSLIST